MYEHNPHQGYLFLFKHNYATFSLVAFFQYKANWFITLTILNKTLMLIVQSNFDIDINDLNPENDAPETSIDITFNHSSQMR